MMEILLHGKTLLAFRCLKILMTRKKWLVSRIDTRDSINLNLQLLLSGNHIYFFFLLRVMSLLKCKQGDIRFKVYML